VSHQHTTSHVEECSWTTTLAVLRLRRLDICSCRALLLVPRNCIASCATWWTKRMDIVCLFVQS
jgi:hypothetical protein